MTEELQELINAPPVIEPNKDLLDSWLKEHEAPPLVLMAEPEYTATVWRFLHPAKSRIVPSFTFHLLVVMVEQERRKREALEKINELANSEYDIDQKAEAVAEAIEKLDAPLQIRHADQ